MNIEIAILCVGVLLVIWYLDQSKPRVLPFSDSREATATLDMLDRNNRTLIAHLVNSKTGSTAHVLGLRLQKRYRSDALREHEPNDPGNTSFTEDKGRVLALCLRDPRTQQRRLHKSELLKFVNLHELAHIGCVSWGHEDEFWRTFKFLLAEAQKIGIYTPQDYRQQPEHYCGLDVSYNPLYDRGLKSCCSV